MTRTLRPTRARGATSLLSLTVLAALAGGPGPAEERPRPVVKPESFDKDPGWEGHNNHVVPARLPTVTQDFGYSQTNFAGTGAGELGGRVTRASEPAFYA